MDLENGTLSLSKASRNIWRCAEDIAQEAYEDAVRYFEQELTQDDEKRDWIRAQTSLQDVVDTLQKARAVYRANNATKARRHVVALSSRIQYYGGVLDALAQHHPEYVALVWGAMKFVVQGVMNHAELIVEISRALVNIADVLPHIKLGMDLYPTIYMKEAVSRVYAHVMLFLRKATKWYRMSPARRALSVLAKPYSIGYKDTVEQIRLCSESVHLVASAAARAELRDQTITLQEQMTKLQERDRDLQDMKAGLQRICNFADIGEVKFTQLIQFAKESQNITNATLGEVNDHGVRLRDIQFSTILQTLKPHRSPADVLYACKTVAQRRQLWKPPTPDSTRYIQTFNQWVNAPLSSLFVLQAGLRAEARAKDLAVQAAILLKDSQHTVFYYLSERRADQNDLSFTDVLQALIFQILTQHPNIAQSESQIVNITAFKSQHTEQEWLDLLSLVLRNVRKSFLVVEMEDLFERTKGQKDLARILLQAFGQLVTKVQDSGNVVKILLVHYAASATPGIPADCTPGHYSVSIRPPVIDRGNRLGQTAKALRRKRFGAHF
ncbi:hypothetical protein LTS15_000142 [Exophiala xenobiotica]|nr:hypothetical protein LTS15_000142 [Exophiala xenobiotica]